MQDGILLKGKRYKHELILYSFGIAYFLISVRYYLIDYYVPDFRLYFRMALGGAKAKDGFSSLFIWFAAFAADKAKQLTFFCLILMTLSMINMSLFIKSLFDRINIYFYVSILLLYSCCAFYYYYGKLFYDFPFTFFTYSICLLVVAKLFKELEDSKSQKAYKIWCIFCTLSGFLLSWKPYNIFCAAGLGLLLLCREKSRCYVISILKTAKKTISSLLFFLMGYVIGNYNLLIDPQSTLEGIRAYPAHYDMKFFLFAKSRIIWDHVNDMPFNISVLTMTTTIIFLFVLPILFKKIYYLGISVFMSGCLYVYIENFSPGYAWHGFVMGLFIITFAAFLLSEIKPRKTKIQNVLIGIALIIQFLTCFVYYVPLQTRWHLITKQAINTLEDRESEIYTIVCKLADETEGSYFTIDNAVKRYRPVPLSPLNRKVINIQNTYLAATNYQFLDPLEATNYEHWKQIREHPLYTNDKNLYQYVIYIEPACFEDMDDVAKLDLYSKFNVVQKVYGRDYSVFLIKK